jgi:hypothetical protein
MYISLSEKVPAYWLQYCILAFGMLVGTHGEISVVSRFALHHNYSYF